MNFFTRFTASLGTRLALFATAAVILVLGGSTLWLLQSVKRQLHEEAIARVAQTTRLVAQMVQGYNAGTVEDLYRAFASMYSGAFSLHAEEKLRTGSVDAPVLMYNNQPVNLHFDAVDSFAASHEGANATVFARMGDDFVRVATSVKKENGDRAVGTLLGKQHPAYAHLMAGQPFAGLAKLFGKDFATRYVPITDGQGAVIGVLYIGLDLTKWIASLRDTIGQVSLGSSGLLYVVDARDGPTLGNLALHPKHQGENLLKTAGAEAFVHALLDAREGQPIADPWDTVAMKAAGHGRIALVAAAPAWGWRIVADVAENEIDPVGSTLTGRLASVGVLGVVVLVVLILALMKRMVTRPLRALEESMTALATGNLDQRIVVARRDEIGAVLSSVAATIHQLSGLVARIREVSEGIDAASQGIAQGNADLSARNQQQADSLQSTAASIEEFTGTVKHNADNAQQANQLAGSASEIAGRAGESMKAVVATMATIAQSSRRIQDIISVIDGIAFQTNILALNAAVEAARAGEQGRGFAVVASEVRNLARRSADAAKEIKNLITAGVRDVDAGAAHVHEAGREMDGAVAAVQRLRDLIGDISSASAEQAAGIERVNHAVTGMEQTTEQNAELVVEAARAAAALQERARELVAAVSRFRTEDTAGSQTAARSPDAGEAFAGTSAGAGFRPLARAA